ncbi:hypothetical protein [Candidatus Nitrotoga sp. BS]|uniref:hypothetical protein n=1 Tax=Candidatus Nitrotoga sp. BS TaxID=2890408 RepID=UPI001EF377FD|nr:hypothetical protein [Candidatus Nitrotoga sp. BS]
MRSKPNVLLRISTSTRLRLLARFINFKPTLARAIPMLRTKMPLLLFPNRHSGRQGAATVRMPLDRGGVQTTLHKMTEACGLKKDLAPQPMPQLCDPPD